MLTFNNHWFTMSLRYPLRLISICIIKFLQYRYRRLSLCAQYQQSNHNLATLRLMQHILHYFKDQFNANGYFHPSCMWSNKDESSYQKLFPKKTFDELELVVWHNPKAVTYYQNKIHTLMKGKSPNYAIEIEKQLKKWNDWN